MARRALGAIGGILLFAWCFGLGLLLRAPRPLHLVLPEQVKHPEQEHNLASYLYGPTLRASSYYRQVMAQHHPAYLVDERVNPTLVEKWASDTQDPAPWVEVRWRGRHRLDKVVIRHAGTMEGVESNARDYKLSCLRNGHDDISIEIIDNHANVAEHALACSNAQGIRLDFSSNATGGLTRVFEVQAWGR